MMKFRRVLAALLVIAGSLYAYRVSAVTAGVWVKQGVVIVPTAGDLNGGVAFSGTSNPDALYEGSCQLISPNGDGKCFKLWFGCANSTCYAESNDAITWTRNGSVIISNLGAPRIFHTGSTYFLYVCAPNVATHIEVYTSSDGITFSDIGSALAVGAGGQWDSNQVFYLKVINIDGGGTWHGTYIANNAVTPWQTGAITSSNGLTWTKSGSNPVTPTGVMVEDAHLIGSTYYGWAQRAIPPVILDPSDIVRISSPDLITWSSEVPTFQRTLSSEGVNNINGELAGQSLVEAAGKTYIFYTGSPTAQLGTGYQVFAAIANMTMASLVQTPERLAGGPTGIAAVQTPTPPAFGSHTSYSSTFANFISVGDFLVTAALIADTSGETMTVADTLGNNWKTTFAPANNGQQTMQIWYAPNSLPGPDTVTVTLSGAAKTGSIFIVEYQGVNTADQGGISTATTGTALSSPSKTTTVANELLIAPFATQNGNLAAMTLGTGSVTRQPALSSAFGLVDRIVSATGTFQATATGNSGNWSAGIFTFYQKPANRNIQAPYAVP